MKESKFKSVITNLSNILYCSLFILCLIIYTVIIITGIYNIIVDVCVDPVAAVNDSCWWAILGLFILIPMYISIFKFFKIVTNI